MPATLASKRRVFVPINDAVTGLSFGAGELLILKIKSFIIWVNVVVFVTDSAYDFVPKVMFTLSANVKVPANVIWSICLTAIWPPET